VAKLPIAREGWPFILTPGIVAAVLALTGHKRLAAACAAASLVSAGFFRDPERDVPSVPGGVLSPADGRVLSRDALLDALYGHGATDTLDRTIDVYVGRLREKLGDDPERPRYIATVRGVGYRTLAGG